MTDYSKLTDGELNRLVAKRLGWREAVLDDTLLLKYPYATPMDRGHWCLVAPDGSVYGVTFKETADSLWVYLFENEVSWATSIDAAAGLDFGEWELHVIIKDGLAYVQALLFGPKGVLEKVTVEHANEARARCIAWLRVEDF